MSHFTDQKLKAQVKAVNDARTEALKLYDQLVPVLKPFVGKKVQKGDGFLTAKLTKALPELRHDLTTDSYVRVYAQSHRSGLFFKVTASVRVGTIESWKSAQHTNHLFMGDFKEGVLQSLAGRPEIRCDYTYEEAKELQNKCKEAKEAYNEAKDALSPFEEAM